MYILGIESSCDETAASVISVAKDKKLNVLSNVISSQIEIHKKYYGVVPEIAAREHVLNVIPVVNEALEKAGIKPADLSAIAVTAGPGLVTSLIIGGETARVLACAWKKPLIAVNHIEGHISANFIQPKEKIHFPTLVLTVSGGHTNLVLMTDYLKYEIIAETLDDAAGEAYDKGAKMMDLGYPGGPIVAGYASEYLAANNGAPKKSDIVLPRPMLTSPSFNFSFSGLKTALLYQLRKDKNWKKRIPEYCYEYQQAILETLIGKTIKAAKKYNVKTIMLSGGVSANSELRHQMSEAIINKVPEVAFNVPNMAYTTDNAAMIAAAGYFKYAKKQFTPWDEFKVDCNISLD
jgi:N6-L-threonylcarbamoyladenine synthase